jgi:hypothetical protein
MKREAFDEDLLTLIETGRVVAILRGQRVTLTTPEAIRPHMHVLSVQEAAKRLNLHHRPRTLLQRLWDWIRD